MVDQNEIAVVWVTKEAQAKADRRPWTVAGTVARVTSSAFSLHPHSCPHSARWVEQGRGRRRRKVSSEGGIRFSYRVLWPRSAFPSPSQSISQWISSDLGT